MLRMKETRHLFGKGAVRTIAAGTEFEPDDELVKAHSDWFETVPTDHEPDDSGAKKTTARKRATAKKSEDDKS